MKTPGSKVKRQSNRARPSPSPDLYSSDLWRPDDVNPLAKLKRLTVLGPYPTEDFFRQVIRQYEPSEILLIVDDGWNRDEIDRIETLCASRKFQVRCASVRNCGLFHAKTYLAEWGTGFATKKRLLWGSLNASQSGFQVNGEVVSALTLDADQERAILPYFHKLWDQDTGSVSRLHMVLLGRVQFLLPEFRFFPRHPEPETFDAWVQAGRLCYKFQRDQTFAKLSVKLKNPLPKDAIESILAKEQLRADTETDTVRYPYLMDASRENSKTGPRWRATYFLETWLGYWTSDSCYRTRKEEFTAQNEQQRKRLITTIKQSTERDRQVWRDGFIERLRRVRGLLNQAGLDAQDYFQMSQNDINLNLYRENARKELESHHKRAHNGIFEERFIKGYEFPPLPRFRGAEAVADGSFEDFVESLCDSILTGKRKTTNKIVQMMRDNLKRYAREMHRWSGQDLAKVVRGDWHKIRANVQAFYT